MVISSIPVVRGSCIIAMIVIRAVKRRAITTGNALAG